MSPWLALTAIATWASGLESVPASAPDHQVRGLRSLQVMGHVTGKHRGQMHVPLLQICYIGTTVCSLALHISDLVLKTLGLGSALKVLFPVKEGDQKLTRQEAVALVNVLERLSSSIEYLQEVQSYHLCPIS